MFEYICYSWFSRWRQTTTFMVLRQIQHFNKFSNIYRKDIFFFCSYLPKSMLKNLNAKLCLQFLGFLRYPVLLTTILIESKKSKIGKLSRLSIIIYQSYPSKQIKHRIWKKNLKSIFKVYAFFSKKGRSAVVD